MWRNEEVARFVEWQRAFNDAGPPQGQTGFYGLDLYSLLGSMEVVLAYFDRTDPDAARLARERYGCFDRFGDRGQAYGLMAGLGNAPSCRQEVIDTRAVEPLERNAAPDDAEVPETYPSGK